MARGGDFRSLSGAQKAAVLMLALGEEQCARLFSMMHEDEIKEISSAMAQLGAIRSDVVERLCVEFAEQIGGAGTLVGSFENTERLLLKTLPRERVAQIMEEIRGPAGRTMWDKLGNVHEAVLANYLKNEYPQTVAVVLSKVRADHAARVLAMLPDSFAMEVVMRMLRMESVQKDVLDGVERTLRAEFMSNLARSTRRDAHEMMAEIFNNLDRQAESRFIAALEERNREAAEKIKSLMFTFDDLQRLTPMAVQTLLRSVEKEKLPLALKGASEKLRDLFFSNLSERAGKMLRDEIEALGPVKLRDVDDAQASIVAQAKEMAAQGQIEIGEGKDEELVYQAMSKHALFTRDFDEPADDGAGVIVLDEPEATEAAPVLTPELVQAVRDAAFAEGLRAGRAEAAAAHEAALQATIGRLVEQMGDAGAALQAVVEDSGTQVAQLVLAMVDAAFPALCARHGGAEVARFSRSVLALLAAEPRIVVRVNPAMEPDVARVVATLDPERRGAVVVEPRDAVPPGDARIAWRHGTAVRDAATLWAEARDALAALGLTMPAVALPAAEDDSAGAALPCLAPAA